MTKALRALEPRRSKAENEIDSSYRDPDSSWHPLSAVLRPTEHAADSSSLFPSPQRSLQSPGSTMTVPKAAGGGYHQGQQSLGATSGSPESGNVHGRAVPGPPFREAEDSSRSFVILMVGACTLLTAMVVLRVVRRWLPDFVLQWSHASENDPRGAFTTYLRQQERERREELRRNRKREDPAKKRERIVKCLEGCAMEVKESDLIAVEPRVPPLDEDISCEDGGHDNGTALCLRGRRTVPNCCAVCLSSYEVGDEVLWSNNPECQHAFHRECILSWLVRKRAYDDDDEEDACPCCRRQFVICRGGKEAEDGESLDAKGRGNRRIILPSPPPRTPDAFQSLPSTVGTDISSANDASVDETSASLDLDVVVNEAAASSPMGDEGRLEAGGGDTSEGTARTYGRGEETLSDMEARYLESDRTFDTSGVDEESHSGGLDSRDDLRRESFSSSDAPIPADETTNDVV